MYTAHTRVDRLAVFRNDFRRPAERARVRPAELVGKTRGDRRNFRGHVNGRGLTKPFGNIKIDRPENTAVKSFALVC